MFKLVVLSALVAVALAASDESKAAVLRLESDISPDGSYQWGYDTENGISANEQGVPKPVEKETPVVASGNYKFKTPEGVDVDITYTADENGYQPQGSVIPQPLPIPDAILRSLEWIAAHPAKPEK